jgi:hypothetical protein
VLAPILALGAVDGLAAMAARALLRASISQRSADDGARRRAMGRLNSAWAVTFATGPAAGGVLSAALSPAAVLWLDVGSFLITAALMFDVPTPRTQGAAGRVSERLRAVMSHVKAHSTLGWLLGTESVAVAFFAAVVPVEIVLVKSTLHGGDAGYGALLAAWGAGTLAGSAVFARARARTLGSLIAASTLAVALGYLGIAASPVLWAACAFAVVGGVGNGMQWIAVVTPFRNRRQPIFRGA